MWHNESSHSDYSYLTWNLSVYIFVAGEALYGMIGAYSVVTFLYLDSENTFIESGVPQKMSGAKVVYMIFTLFCILGSGSVIFFQQLTTVVGLVRTISWLVVFLMPITRTIQLYMDIVKLMASQNTHTNITKDNNDEENLKNIIFIFRLYITLWVPSTTLLLSVWIEPNAFLQAMLHSGLFSYIIIKYWYVIKLRDVFANKQQILTINGMSPIECHLQHQGPRKTMDTCENGLETCANVVQIESGIVSVRGQNPPISTNDVCLVGSDSAIARDAITHIIPTMTTQDSSTQVEAPPSPISVVHVACQTTPDSPKHSVRYRSNSEENPKSLNNPDLSLSFDNAMLGSIIRKISRVSEQASLHGAVDDPKSPSIHDLREYRQRRLSTAKQRRSSQLSSKNKNKIERIGGTVRSRSNSEENLKSSNNPDLSLSFDTAMLGSIIRKTRRMSEQSSLPGAAEDPKSPSIHDLREYRQRRLSTAKQLRRSSQLSPKIGHIGGTVRSRSNSEENVKSSNSPDLSLSFDTAMLGSIIRKTHRMSEQSSLPGAAEDPKSPSIHDLREYRQRRLSTAKERRRSSQLSLKNKNKIGPIDRTEEGAFST